MSHFFLGKSTWKAFTLPQLKKQVSSFFCAFHSNDGDFTQLFVLGLLLNTLLSADVVMPVPFPSFLFLWSNYRLSYAERIT